MWIMPSTPSSSAVQPIAARTVSELRSGCRRNRQASSTASTGITQASEPNASVVAMWMARPAALLIRPHSEAASTIATPRVSSPTPSRRWCGSRSRAPRPTALAANPTAPAATIQAAAIMRPVHPIRITTGSWDAPPLAARPLAARPFAVRPFPALPLEVFFFWPERGWVPRPGLALPPRGAGDLVVVLPRPPDPLRLVVPVWLLVRLPELGRVRLPPSWSGSSNSRASSASPPRGRADPLRARVAILTNVARTRDTPKHQARVSAQGPIRAGPNKSAIAAITRRLGQGGYPAPFGPKVFQGIGRGALVQDLAGSGIGGQRGARAAAADPDQVPPVLGQGPLLGALHGKAGLGDHLQVAGAGLALAGQVVAEEDRVDDVQRERLQAAQVDLAAAGQPDLGVRADEPDHGQDAQAAPRGEGPLAAQRGALERDQEVDRHRVGVEFS